MEPMPSLRRQVAWAMLLVSVFAAATFLCATWKSWWIVPARVVVRYSVVRLAGEGTDVRAMVLDDPAELGRLWSLLRWTTEDDYHCGCEPVNYLTVFDPAGGESRWHFCGGPDRLRAGPRRLYGTERFYGALRDRVSTFQGRPVGLEARGRDLK